MRIALIAHDSRKELLAQFCTAYVRILSQNELVATGVTGKVVHDACGLPVRCLYPGARGGAEQISSMIACGEIDMLLFFTVYYLLFLKADFAYCSRIFTGYNVLLLRSRFSEARKFVSDFCCRKAVASYE